jgi:hypothetical protein
MNGLFFVAMLLFVLAAIFYYGETINCSKTSYCSSANVYAPSLQAQGYSSILSYCAKKCDSFGIKQHLTSFGLASFGLVTLSFVFCERKRGVEC